MSAPSYRRGRLPEDKSKPKLQFGDFVTSLPDHPLIDTIPSLDFPMDHNDEVGCCVVAGADHALRVIDTLLLGSYDQPTDDTLLAWYQSQNPDFTDWSMGGSSADRGMIIADFLAWLVKRGTILGFAKIDHTNPDQVRAAIYIGLAIVTGEDVREAQMNSTVWDYTPKSPDDGGHCTVCHDYQPNRLGVVTWGSGNYAMTDAYLQYGVDEAYIVITKAHVDHPGFRNHFDLSGFAAAYKQITSRNFPVPVTPSPNPTPTPTPAASRNLTFASDEDVTSVLRFAHGEHFWHVNVNAKAAINRASWS